jgi:hypothetical protein
MKNEASIGKKGLYIGAGIGMVLFAIVGLLPSSLSARSRSQICGHIFGLPLGTAVSPALSGRIFMVLGVLVTGLVFVVGLSLIGWAGGTLGKPCGQKESSKSKTSMQRKRRPSLRRIEEVSHGRKQYKSNAGRF